MTVIPPGMAYVPAAILAALAVYTAVLAGTAAWQDRRRRREEGDGE